MLVLPTSILPASKALLEFGFKSNAAIAVAGMALLAAYKTSKIVALWPQLPSHHPASSTENLNLNILMKKSEKSLLDMDKRLTKLVETGGISLDTTKITALLTLTYVVSPKQPK